MDDKGKILDEMKAMGLKAVDAFHRELARLRTGRANISILDDIRVDYYGTLTPLAQMATLSVPESRLITVQPWDITQMQAVEKAILASDLGLNPANDGKIIRIQIPQLTEERRKDLVKVAKKYAEECKVSVRNSRRDANEALKKLEKDKALSEDDLKKILHDVQNLTDKEVAKVEEILTKKEKEIVEV